MRRLTDKAWFWLLVMPSLLTPPYVLTNHLTLFSALPVPQLAIDRLIPFHPAWAIPYLALFPLMWWTVLAQADGSAARRVVLSYAAAAAGACLCFLLLPTSYERQPWTEGGIYGLITTVDTPRNACPSLHGAYAVMSALWLSRTDIPAWPGWLAAGVVLLATLAVRQHGVIDLGCGALLGSLVWRRAMARVKAI